MSPMSDQQPAPLLDALVRAEEPFRAIETMASGPLAALIQELRSLLPSAVGAEFLEHAESVAASRYIAAVEAEEIDELNAGGGGGSR